MSSPQRGREHGDRAEKSVLISALPRRPPRLCGEDYGKQIRIDPFHETGSSAMRALGVLLVTILFAFLASISGGTQNPNQLLTERAYQDREILYELQTPESHAFRITHDYTERKEGEKYYFNVVRAGSHVTDPESMDLDSGENLKWEVISGQRVKERKLPLREAQDDSEVVVTYLARPVGKGEST